MKFEDHATETPPSEENRVSSPIAPKKVERTVTGTRWLLVCIAIFSANLLFGLDNTIVADIQGAIADTYDEYTQIGWLGVGFLYRADLAAREALPDCRLVRSSGQTGVASEHAAGI